MAHCTSHSVARVVDFQSRSVTNGQTTNAYSKAQVSKGLQRTTSAQLRGSRLQGLKLTHASPANFKAHRSWSQAAALQVFATAADNDTPQEPPQPPQPPAPVQEIDPEVQKDLDDIADIKFVLEKLRQTRDMTYSEAKLIITIEDPRAKERRDMYGIEEDSGCSREDVGMCLQQVHDGEEVTDRLALRQTAQEMRDWPYLNIEMPSQSSSPSSSPYADITDTGIEVDMSKQDDEEIEGAGIFGYGALYLVSGIPVIIGIVTVTILFVNSLR